MSEAKPADPVKTHTCNPITTPDVNHMYGCSAIDWKSMYLKLRFGMNDELWKKSCDEAVAKTVVVNPVET